METLEEEALTTYNRLAKNKKPKVSVPTEIMEEIVLRLPVKSILRFRSVSKPWLSRISDPSFTKLHSTRATTAFFLSGYDHPTRKRYFFTAGRDGGPVSHLITLDDDSLYSTSAKHVNGLVLFACLNQAFVVNPSMHKFFKIPVPDSLTNSTHIRYVFGYHESTNEHKILHINIPETPAEDTAKMMIFSMSTYSWREIQVDPPAGYGWDQLYNCDMTSACVNSVVHFMLPYSETYILAFDLRSEMFSVISIPEGVLLRDDVESEPYIVKINGCLGVCHDHMEEHSEIDIWILKDYENRVWVRETITFPRHLIELDFRFLVEAVESVNMDEIFFSSLKSFENVWSVPIYNIKTRCFKSLEFTWGHQFPMARCLWFRHISCYVESMVPL